MISSSANSAPQDSLRHVGKNLFIRNNNFLHRDLIAPLVFVILSMAAYRDVLGKIELFNFGFFSLQYTEPMIFASLVTLIMVSWQSIHIRASQLRISLLKGLLITYGCLFVFAFMRGLPLSTYNALFSLRSIGVELLILFIGAFARPEWLWSRRIEWIVIAFGLLLSCVALLRIVFGATFMTVGDVVEADFNDGGRALSSQGTLIVGVALVLALARSLASTIDRKQLILQGLTPCILMLGLLASRQGTASIASFAGILTLFGFMPGPSRPARILITAIFISLAILFLNNIPEFITSINQLLPSEISIDVQQREGNLDTRLAIWQGLITSYNSWSIFDKLFGLPAGVEQLIYIVLNGAVIEWLNGMHSQYYGLLADIGASGLTIYLIIMTVTSISCISRIFSGSFNVQYYAAVGQSLLVILLIQGYSYDLRNETNLFLILATSSAEL